MSAGSSPGEADLTRLLHAADRVVESSIELGSLGGLGRVLDGRRPKSRADVLDRLQQARDALADLLADAWTAPPLRRAARHARRIEG